MRSLAAEGRGPLERGDDGFTVHGLVEYQARG